MRELIKLERMGYEFALDGESVSYICNSERPDKAIARPLLEALRAHRDEAIDYLQTRDGYDGLMPEMVRELLNRDEWTDGEMQMVERAIGLHPTPVRRARFVAAVHAKYQAAIRSVRESSS